MAAQEIIFQGGKPSLYTNYTLTTFSDWRALQAAAKYIDSTKPNAAVSNANRAFKNWVEAILRDPSHRKLSSYGMFGKHPRSYKEAIEREKFLYYDEYKKIKKNVEKKIAEELQKSSITEAMKPRLVFNDKQIGEFVFDRAAMSLQPEIFYYSPSKKREIDILSEKIIYEGERMYLDTDKSLVVHALKVEKKDGSIEFIQIKGEESLQEAVSKGIISCTSNNKKVYLYKEKKPKTYNGVKIIVGLTMGGFTNWVNDFYTGIAACVVTDVLEGLGYSVDVEVAVGGGRCPGCYKKLKFGNSYTDGRRFFTFTAKSFDEQLDLDGLLYTLSDPSFHNIKFVSLLNSLFNFFGDQIDEQGNPASTWHGISERDMMNPIGAYHKAMDYKKGNKNLLHFYIHQVKSEDDVVRQITDLVLTCENKNLEALKKYSTHDFGLDK
jgi:hypothetical protein